MDDLARFRCLAALMLCCGLSAPVNAELRAAAGRVEVTPVEGSYLAGYGRDRRMTGRLDPLYAHAVVISDGETTINLVSIDSIGLTWPDISPIRDRLSGATVVTSTHTHASPDVVGIWGPNLWRSGRSDLYQVKLENRIVELVQGIRERLVAVDLFTASVDAPMDWVENLSEPGLLDTRLTVLQLVAEDSGRTLATLTNYACHPTILGPDNTQVSADYVAGFYEVMRKSLPGQHVFLQGAIGGWVQPLQGDRSHDLALQTGRSLGRSALAALEQRRRSQREDLDYRESSIKIPLENWGFRLLMWLGVLDRQTEDGAMSSVVSVFRWGNTMFVTHPGETSPAYSLASRALFPDHPTLVLGLTHDAMGYILKPEYFDADADYPHGDYLTSVSVGSRAGPVVMGAVSDLAGGHKAGD